MYYSNKHIAVAKSDSNDISRLTHVAGYYNTLNHFSLRTSLMDYLKLCGDHSLTPEKDHEDYLTK
jgi:hypothetical protein